MLLFLMKKASSRLINVLRLARPLFLVGGFIFYGLGVMVALYQEVRLDVTVLLWGQVAVTATQLMTHFSNDYYDLSADRANTTPTRWSGGSRVLAEGLVSPRTGLWLAVACGAVALAATAILVGVARAGPWAVGLLLVAVALARLYSAPPLRLHSRGLGELTVSLIVPVLTPAVGYTLQVGRPGWLPLLVVFPLACFQAAMILVINFPDAAGDLQAGKRTLVVRLGAPRAARLHAALLATAYLSLPLLVGAGLPPLVGMGLLVPLPLGGWLVWRMVRGAWREPAAWGGLAFWSIGLLMASAGLALLTFGWLTV